MTESENKDHQGTLAPGDVPAEWLTLSSDNIGESAPVDMGALLKAKVAEHSERQLIRGRVVAITPTDVLIDVGLKSEGVVPKEEFKKPCGLFGFLRHHLDKLPGFRVHCRPPHHLGLILAQALRALERVFDLQL